MESTEKPRLWTRLHHWISEHHKIVWIISGVIAICAGGAATYFILTQKSAPVDTAPVVEVKEAPKPKPKYYSPLTGNLVETEAATKQAVTGIMIENSPDARPQSGLKDSGVVFEAIAEGGITRFLVLYQQEKPQLIGPVRSLRLYDVDWLAAFDASIGHVGGSAAALVEIRNGTYRDIDQFFNPGSYWRSTDRYAPHNVYTNFEKLDALNVAKGYTTSTFTGFTRVDGKASATPDATAINVAISGFLYDSTYAYDIVTNTYARSQAGEPHLDRESGQIAPSVLVVMRVDETKVYEDGYREAITTIGSGAATIFQNGIATNVTWTKASKLGQITFTDAVGVDVPLVRGQTWIIAIPNGSGDVTWQ
ncbi:MAG TPA: DUF3048 domain-containing protein [Candidatus Angelobacter sp.]|nr:DUF3048 domain-containing protein [Candidatus Angelobacter sp.]